jgi:hypothetical protein
MLRRDVGTRRRQLAGRGGGLALVSAGNRREDSPRNRFSVTARMCAIPKTAREDGLRLLAGIILIHPAHRQLIASMRGHG